MSTDTHAETIATVPHVPTGDRGEVLIRRAVTVIVEPVADLGRRRVVGGPASRVAGHARGVGRALPMARATHTDRGAISAERCDAHGEVLIHLAITIVVGRIADFGRDLHAGSTGGRRAEGALVVTADDDSDTALADRVAVVPHGDTEPIEAVVDQTVAVVVDTVAALGLDHREWARRERRADDAMVVSADILPVGAAPHPSAGRAQRDTIGRGDSVVDHAVAIVVEPIAELGRRRAVGLSGRCGANAVPLVGATISPGPADAGAQAVAPHRNAVREEALVHLTIAVVVQQVATLRDRGGLAAIRVHRTDREPVETLDDAGPARPFARARGAECDPIPDEAIVGGAIAVFVDPIAGLSHGEGECRAGRRPVRGARDDALATPRAAEARRAERDALPRVAVVDETIAVIVQAVAPLDARGELLPVRVRRAGDRPAALEADDYARAAFADRVARLARFRAISTVREALILQTVAVVVAPVTTDLVPRRNAAGHVGLGNLGIARGRRRGGARDTDPVEADVAGVAGVCRHVTGLTRRRAGARGECRDKRDEGRRQRDEDPRYTARARNR